MNIRPLLLPPGQMKPGNRITWTASTTGGKTGVREGTVWSRGPQPGTLWVIPDGVPGDRTPVLVCWQHRTYVRAPAWPHGGAA